MMNPNEIRRSSLLDLLFAGRNQQYGAYVLRKHYPRRLAIALAATFGMASAIFLLVLAFGNAREIVENPWSDDGTVVIIPKTDDPLPEPQKVEPPKTKPVPASSSINATPPVIVPDEKVPDPMPTQDDYANRRIDNVTTDVPGGGDPAVAIPPSGNGPGQPAPAANPPAPEPAFVAEPDEKPYFPGGPDAWRRYLVEHINTPGDMEPGEKRSVTIRFLVDADGSLTGFEVVRSGGASFDNEVLRVMRKMPKWKPARQKGRAVATSFAQPVTFQAPEE